MKDRINEMLENGDEVKLVCIDRDAFVDSDPEFYKRNSLMSLFDYLIVNKESKLDCLMVSSPYMGYEFALLDSELKYFKIKETEYTFNDLIDVAVQAAKDGILHVREITPDSLRFSKVGGLRGNSYYYCSSKYLGGIEHIKSLYFETFVIESEEDELRIKQPVKSIVLANGVEIIDEDRLMLLSDSGLCLNGGAVGGIKIPFSFLKGATVTQERGV